MIEIQCTSCHTRYRIDQRALPEETPTFKCSRCGHVFRAEPRQALAKAVVREERAESDRSAPEAKIEERDEIERRADERGGGLDDSEHEPLDRTFDDRLEDAKPGENLTFEFDEPAEHDDSARLDVQPEEPDDEWEVGENPMTFEERKPEPAPAPARAIREVAPRLAVARSGRRPATLEATIPSDVAALAERGKIRSAGAFIALFTAVILTFGAICLLICGAPAASAALLSTLPGIGDRFAADATAQSRVTIGGVDAEYRQLNGGQRALVVTGRAANNSGQALHTIQIEASLLDGTGHGIGSRAIFLGNALAGEMIDQMTVRELEVFEGLQPARSFVLERGQAAAFAVVFVDPPSSRQFKLSVLKAEAADGGGPRS